MNAKDRAWNKAELIRDCMFLSPGQIRQIYWLVTVLYIRAKSKALYKGLVCFWIFLVLDREGKGIIL